MAHFVAHRGTFLPFSGHIVKSDKIGGSLENRVFEMLFKGIKKELKMGLEPIEKSRKPLKIRHFLKIRGTHCDTHNKKRRAKPNRSTRL